MRFYMLCRLLLLSCLCLALAQVSYDDCCLKYVKKMGKITQKHAVSYRHQKPDGGCNIPAVIIIMKKGRMFCANPKEKWVKELLQKIDEKGQKYRKHYPQHSHTN